MAKKRITRKELLKKPDEFLTFSSKIIEFISAHPRQLKYLVVGVTIVIVAYISGYFYLDHINEKAQEAYNKAYYTLTEVETREVTTDTLRKSGELFKNVIDKYGMSKIARLAISQVAYVRFQNKKFDEAIALYKKFIEKVSGDSRYESLANMALATCYEAKGDFQAAIERSKAILEIPDNPFRETALLNLARLFRLDNNPEKAKEFLREFVQECQNSPFLPLVKSHL
ncbi:MAG: tetratricopeptide repeat protein [Deltaproteobacteria bacterium]|nr:tetratricopeptide repeat protein [Deltaproteobacteria bacterium]